MDYTYMLLHPCANIIVDRIFDMLNQKNIEVEAVYRISGWNAILNNLYKNTYTKKATIQMHVQAHAYINRYFFGNTGLVLLLRKNIPYDCLIKETINIKYELRQMMSETKDGPITILLDTNRSICKLGIENTVGSLNHRPQQENHLSKIFFSYVHCPDTIEQYMEDFESLRDYLKNGLSPRDIENVRKYRSFYCE